MAGMLSVAAGVVAVVNSALEATVSLHGVIRDLQSQRKEARALKSEVSGLTVVLKSLLESAVGNPTLNLSALELPLQCCGQACEEYGVIIKQATQLPPDGRKGARNWVKQKYLQGDIEDFKAMLAVYKSTFEIALADANLKIARPSPEAFEDYKDMICDTTSDLETYLWNLMEKADRLQAEHSIPTGNVPRNVSVFTEKENTRDGLEMCAQLSARLVEFESSSTKEAQSSHHLSVPTHVKSGISEVKGSIKSLEMLFRAHDTFLDGQSDIARYEVSGPIASQLVQLQQTMRCIRLCIEIVSAAGGSVVERRGALDSISRADLNLKVTTMSELVQIRRQIPTQCTRQFVGHLPDSSIEHLLNLSGSGPTSSSNIRALHSRFGPRAFLSTQRITGDSLPATEVSTTRTIPNTFDGGKGAHFRWD